MKGKNIKELRKRNHMSQKELAERIGVSRQTISLWENEACDPGFENLHAICDVFHIQTGLFEDEVAVSSTEPEKKISKFWLVLGILGLLFLVAVLVITLVVLFAFTFYNNKGYESEQLVIFGLSPIEICITVLIVLSVIMAIMIHAIWVMVKNRKSKKQGKK